MKVPTLGNDIGGSTGGSNSYVNPNPAFPSSKTAEASKVVPSTIKSVFDFANGIYRQRAQQMEQAETAMKLAQVGAEATRLGVTTLDALKKNNAADDEFRPTILKAYQEFYDNQKFDDPLLKARAYEQIQRASIAVEASADDYVMERKKQRTIAAADENIFYLQSQFADAPNETIRQGYIKSMTDTVDMAVSVGAMTPLQATNTKQAFISDGYTATIANAVNLGNLKFAKELYSSKKKLIAQDKQVQIVNMISNEEERIKHKMVSDAAVEAQDYIAKVYNTGTRMASVEKSLAMKRGDNWADDVKKIEVAAQQGGALMQFKSMPNSQIAAVLNEISADIKNPNGSIEGTYQKVKMFDSLSTAANEIVKARQKTPVDAALDAFPNAKTPDEILDAQKKLGIPDFNRGVLLDTQVSAIAQQLVNTQQPADVLTTFDELKNTYKNNFDYAMQDLKRNKLPYGFAFTSTIDSNLDRKVAIASAKVAIQGAKSVWANDDTIKKQDVVESLLTEVDDYRASLAASGMPMSGDETGHLAATAGILMKEGMDQSDAAEQVAKVFNSKYQYTEYNDKTIRIPQGSRVTPPMVQRYITKFFDKAPDNLEVVYTLDRTGTMPVALWDDVKQNGYFATLPNDAGLVLMYDGLPLYVAGTRKDGPPTSPRLIVKSFDDIRTDALSIRENNPTDDYNFEAPYNLR